MKAFFATVFLLLISTVVFAQAAPAIPPVTLTWQDNSGNEDGFHIKRNLNGGTFVTIATTTPNINSAIDTTRFATIGVANTFCYVIDAFNSAGKSGDTNTACSQVIAALPVPVTIPNAASNLLVTVPAP